MTKVAIRQATSQDADLIAALVNAAYRPEPGSEGWTHEADLVSGSRTDSSQVSCLLESSTILVAVNGDQILGCVQIQAKGRESHIGMLAVHPSSQTAGLGKLLLSEAEALAQSNFDAEHLILLVVAERQELIDFYVRRGYKQTGDFQAYPVAAGVGTPRDPNARLAVLHKHLTGQVHPVPRSLGVQLNSGTLND